MILNNLRIWGSGVRISSGAPFAYKTANMHGFWRVTGNDRRQRSLITDNSDFVVSDFDLRNYRAEIGFFRLNITCIEFFLDQS
jgi:hypothetical protein